MTLSINGHVIGAIKQPLSQSGGMAIKEPNSPGDTLIPAYKTGVVHDKFSMEVIVASAEYHSVVATLKNLCRSEPCLYLHDDLVPLYDDVYSCWALVPSWKSQLVRMAGGQRLGTISLECTVTDDHEGSSYTP